MSAVNHFEDLVAWQEARKLVQMIYALTRGDAFARDFGLQDQIQRAAVSIMANIAEGFDSRTTAEYLRFLGYARRSAGEVQSLLYVALDTQKMSQETFDRMYAQCERVKALIGGLTNSLRRRLSPQ